MNRLTASEKKILRILDANLNRSKEGLRVVEDLLRFILDDRKLSSAAKSYRHRLSFIAGGFPIRYESLLDSRDSRDDVGAKGWIQDKKKIDAKQVMISNLKRCQESLRVLEEVSKIVFSKAAPQFQNLRFQIYELERKAVPKF